MPKALLLAVVLSVCVLPAHAQMKDVYTPGVPPPPPPLDPDRRNATSDEPKLRRHVDAVKLQQEADALARTAQTIPSDVASIRAGTLPKDIIEKLKRIEKLSKQLRNELNP